MFNARMCLQIEYSFIQYAFAQHGQRSIDKLCNPASRHSLLSHGDHDGNYRYICSIPTNDRRKATFYILQTNFKSTKTSFRKRRFTTQNRLEMDTSK